MFERSFLTSIAVVPEWQGNGVGGALVRALLSRETGPLYLMCDDSREQYYERFGFFATKTQHLVMPGPFERNRFLALELKPGWLDGVAGMLAASGRRFS